MSLVDEINDSASAEAGTDEVVDPGSMQEQITDARTPDSAGTEALPGDHTEGSEAQTASPAKPPEETDPNADSLIDKMNGAHPKDEAAPVETKTGADAGAEPEKTPEELEAAEAERQLQADLLGTGEAEAETDPVWKERYDQQTQYYQQLEENQRDREAAQEKLLKNLGWKVINTDDGMSLTVSEEATAKLAEGIDINGIVNGLTSSELKLFCSDEEEGGDPAKAAKLITEKVAQVFATKVPSITARPEDEIITSAERDSVYDSFLAEKLADGKTPRFPDCEKPEVFQKLKSVYASKDPVMKTLSKAATRSEAMQRVLLEFGFLRLFRAQHGAKSMAAAAKLKLDAKIETNKKEVSLGGSGGNQGGRTADGSTQTETQRITSLYGSGAPTPVR